MCPDHLSYQVLTPRGEKSELLALGCHVMHPKKSSRERKSGMIDSGKNREWYLYHRRQGFRLRWPFSAGFYCSFAPFLWLLFRIPFLLRPLVRMVFRSVKKQAV
ncbi:hypothetical protein CEXT_472001 [Caerostris extrusa]|uniref:Uncharacterized protein n=1 Tax=Caerostris extrusa TaxID=172846 RepID=A0AAV4T7I6_CAEEX|nr:hypothetical protein CEXT_472001 [Caerostris extrusa]